MGLIQCTNVCKSFGEKVALDNVSVDIPKGKIFGLLGPNGAGKSTTMNMICAIVRPTAGSVELLGKNPWKQKKDVIHKIGYIPQELAIHGKLRAWENVELFTSLYGIKGAQLKAAVNSSLEYVGLLDRRQEFAKNFSGGMKRRLNIACAIGHNPELLIFDEPTVGIDPQSRNFILEKIKESNRNGATVIYTSHYMEEVEAICTRIAIMDNGKIIACGTSEELSILDDLSELIDEARETNDQAVRTELYEEAMGYILDLAVELPVYQRSVLYAYNSKVIDSDSISEEINPYSSPLDRIWEIEFAA